MDIGNIKLFIIPMLYYTKAPKLPVQIPREQSKCLLFHSPLTTIIMAALYCDALCSPIQNCFQCYFLTLLQNTDSLSFVCHETFSQKSKGLNGKDSFHVKKGFQNKYSESLEMFFVSICPSLHLPLSVFLSLSNLYSHNNAL